jgi:hypothetical protein
MRSMVEGACGGEATLFLSRVRERTPSESEAGEGKCSAVVWSEGAHRSPSPSGARCKAPSLKGRRPERLGRFILRGSLTLAPQDPMTQQSQCKQR